MGNSQSPQAIEKCLLNRKQFEKLRKGDVIDHRNTEGQFLSAKIIYNSRYTVKLHYIGYSQQYDIEVPFIEGDFAIHKSVSQRPASGSLSKCKNGYNVLFRPMASDNCKWRQGRIIQMHTSRNGEIISGQVCIKFRTTSGQEETRWTHLDNQYEIRLTNSAKQQRSQSRGGHKSRNYNHNNNNNNNNCHHYHQHNTYDQSNYGNNNNYQYQTQIKAQVKKQDEMTIDTQLLIDDTKHQCKLINDYLKTIMDNNKTKNDIKTYNQKVVIGLQLFQMKVKGLMMETEDYTDAFKSSAMIIRQFESEFKSQFGYNKIIMQRLDPCLNYMRAVLQGKKNIPQLPYINDYTFDQKTVSSVMSKVVHASSHKVPARMKEINDNNQHYKDGQKKLKQQYEQSGYEEKVEDVNYNSLIQDYNTNNIAFGLSHEEQRRIMEKDNQRGRFAEPCDELMGNTGNESDIGNSDREMEVDFGNDLQ